MPKRKVIAKIKTVNDKEILLDELTIPDILGILKNNLYHSRSREYRALHRFLKKKYEMSPRDFRENYDPYYRRTAKLPADIEVLSVNQFLDSTPREAFDKKTYQHFTDWYILNWEKFMSSIHFTPIEGVPDHLARVIEVIKLNPQLWKENPYQLKKISRWIRLNLGLSLSDFNRLFISVGIPIFDWISKQKTIPEYLDKINENLCNT